MVFISNIIPVKLKRTNEENDDKDSDSFETLSLQVKSTHFRYFYFTFVHFIMTIFYFYLLFRAGFSTFYSTTFLSCSRSKSICVLNMYFHIKIQNMNLKSWFRPD